MKKLLSVVIVFCAHICAAERVNVDEGWTFIQEDVPAAATVDFSEADWRTLDLPHDWSVEGRFDPGHPTTDRCGYLPTGVGWYRDGKLSVATDIPDLTEREIFTYDWTDNPHRANRKQFYKSSYDNATVRSPARRAIAQIRDIPNNAGMYRWTGHDYLGEAGLASGGWPFKLFSGGACDLANFEKDLYYLYQSQWTTEPMVHLLPHWTHPAMTPGTEIPVWVYSNCDEVELFLNGTSLGKQAPGTEWQHMQCQWMVGWTPGTLTAVGYFGGHQVAEKTFRTADAPAQISLSVDGCPLAASGKDIVQVRVTISDAKAEFYPYGENRVFFSLHGPGRIKALDNGKPNDVEPFHGTTDRTAFFGLARAYIESTKEAGDIALVAGAILGDKRLVVSDIVHIDARHIALRGTPVTPTLEIFYTTDGSQPSTRSTRYTGGFRIPLGTTVKAVVTIDGATALTMHERFAGDVGLIWNGAGQDADFGGDQAEDAEFVGAHTSTEGRNYNGSGFLEMGTRGATVAWYHENDGAAATVQLRIRYSGTSGGKRPFTLRLNVNENMIDTEIILPPTANSGRQWNTVSVPITLQRGANTIRLTTMDDRSLLIDEISVGPAGSLGYPFDLPERITADISVNTARGTPINRMLLGLNANWPEGQYGKTGYNHPEAQKLIRQPQAVLPTFPAWGVGQFL